MSTPGLAPTLHNIEKILTQKRDASLVKSILAGNTDAFARLMSLYKKKITSLGMGFFKNEADTEDFVQEVFLKVFEKLKTYRGESSFSTWITRVSYNMAINSIKRKKEYDAIPDETTLEDPDFSPEEKEIRKLTIEALHEALGELPEKYSVCLNLYFFHDISYEQINEITDLPINTIKSHIFRAKKILREKLRSFYEL